MRLETNIYLTYIDILNVLSFTGDSFQLEVGKEMIRERGIEIKNNIIY